MPGVLLAQDGLLRGDAPVDAEAVVCYRDACVGLRVVELIAFVLEDGCLAQHGETVGEAFRDEELAVVLFRKLHGDVLPVGGRAAADVDGHVEDGSPDAPHELALREGRPLEVQAAHDAVLRHALVVLHEADGADLLVELPLREGFEEIPAGIPEDARLYDEYALDGSLDYFHVLLFSL